MRAMKSLIIDDQPLIVAGLQAALATLQTPLETTCAASPEQAQQLLASDSQFDLVLLDLELENSGGLDFLGRLLDKYPTLPIVVLSASSSIEMVRRALAIGAMGIVFKRESFTQVSKALHLALSRLGHVSPIRFPSRTEGHNGYVVPLGTGSVGSRASNGNFARGLTSRQKDVLELLVLGQSNKLIARKLNVSVETVKEHVAALLRIFNVASRTQVVLAVTQSCDKALNFSVTAPGAGIERTLNSDVRTFVARK